ncbi:unnamed protein product, partial [Amoebophrya sp. A25]
NAAAQETIAVLGIQVMEESATSLAASGGWRANADSGVDSCERLLQVVRWEGLATARLMPWVVEEILRRTGPHTATLEKYFAEYFETGLLLDMLAVETKKRVRRKTENEQGDGENTKANKRAAGAVASTSVLEAASAAGGATPASKGGTFASDSPSVSVSPDKSAKGQGATNFTFFRNFTTSGSTGSTNTTAANGGGAPISSNGTTTTLYNHDEADLANMRSVVLAGPGAAQRNVSFA